jgi:hypothetical protein
MSHDAHELSILYIVLEDFSTLASPTFGALHSGPTAWVDVRNTPHMQRLASRGAVFQRAYCQAPICNPSRTSFLTSRRPSTTRVFSNEDTTFPSYILFRLQCPHAPELPTLSVPSSCAWLDRLPTLVDFVRDAHPDAAIACAGKIFHVACDREPRGFTNGAQLLRDQPALTAASDARLQRLLNRSATPHAALRATLYASPSVGRTNDQEKARAMVRLLAHYAMARRRFFLALGLASTHGTLS